MSHPHRQHLPRHQAEAWRAALWALRPLVVPAVLLTGAVVVGGTPGVLLGFAAVLTAIDRLLDRGAGVPGWALFEAERSYRRLARGRRRDALMRRLRRRPGDGARLAYLPDDTGWAAAAERRRLGMQTIAVASIVGTTDPSKAAAFDARFCPPAWSRERWTLICLATLSGAVLPPIAVYRVNGEHYVRDGHHRVSVAKALAVEAMDADVVELVGGSS